MTYLKKIAGISTALMLSGQIASAATNITVADAFPTGHYLSEQAMKYWMDQVTDRTDGEVTFTYFTSGQMGSLADMLDMAQTGVADVVYVPMSSFADRLPLSGVAELPGFFDTAVKGTTAFQSLLESDLAAAEFEPNGVMPLMGALLPPYQIASAGTAIKADEDWDGLRLRTPGGILEIAANAVGATAVPMGGPDMYAAMQRGTVDATVNAFASLNSYKLNELLKAVSSNASFGSFAFTMVINKDVFAGLTPEIQAAMLEAGDATSTHVAEWMDANEQTIAQKFADQGIEIYQVNPDALASWNTKLGEVAKTWATRLDERGLAGSGTLDSWKAAVAATN